MDNIIFSGKKITPFAIGALTEIEKFDPNLTRIIAHCTKKDSGIYHYDDGSIKVPSIFRSTGLYSGNGMRFNTSKIFTLISDDVYVQGAWQNSEGNSCPCIDTLIKLINALYKEKFKAEKRTDGTCVLYDISTQSNTTQSNTTHLQTIYYGAPGTGKSFKVKEEINKITGSKENEFVFRTTFHPDYDYASFVGCFKPVSDNNKIKYRFQPQIFIDAYVKAWQNSNKNIVLVIEEINRGNCAQIFGDIFQLLDRKEDGISEYSIKIDNDIATYLKESLGEEHEAIKDSKIKLPNNFSIIATMNTSDQSLFPMDSAFKRRWDWEYVEIKYDNDKSKDFKIIIDNTHSYKWVDFLKVINDRILDITKSEDKQIGDFFIKGDVDCNQFIGKVMFYLWNDVCKENYGTNDNLFRKRNDIQEQYQDSSDEQFSFSQLIAEKKNTIIGFMNSLGVKKIQ